MRTSGPPNASSGTTATTTWPWPGRHRRLRPQRGHQHHAAQARHRGGDRAGRGTRPGPRRPALHDLPDRARPRVSATAVAGKGEEDMEDMDLAGRNIALIFEKASTRTRSAFEVAAHDEGAHVTYLGPEESQIGYKESMKDTARVLGRMFDGIEY